MTAVSLDYRPPDARFRDCVSLFYDFRCDLPIFADVERADLAQFRFLLAGHDPHYRFADGHEAFAPRIQLIGPTAGPTETRVGGPAHVFGFGLCPAGWAALVGLDASLFVNRVVDAAALFDDDLAELARILAAADGIEGRIALVSPWLDRAIARRGDGGRFTRLVDDWLAASLSPELDALIAASGLSPRQLERQCKRYYGVPPKLLARKYRALKAAVALARGEAVPHELQGEFYDQSHLIREIKQFTGVTPRKFAEDASLLAALTLQRTQFDELSPLVVRT